MFNHSTSPTSDDICVIRSHIQRIEARLGSVEEALTEGNAHHALILIGESRQNLGLVADTLAQLADALYTHSILAGAPEPYSGLDASLLFGKGGL
jgi:hypothetical protein